MTYKKNRIKVVFVLIYNHMKKEKIFWIIIFRMIKITETISVRIMTIKIAVTGAVVVMTAKGKIERS